MDKTTIDQIILATLIIFGLMLLFKPALEFVISSDISWKTWSIITTVYILAPIMYAIIYTL